MQVNNEPVIIAKASILQLMRRGEWEYVERPDTPGVVAVVSVVEEKRLLLVEQFRPPLNRTVIELPAGLAGDLPGQGEESLAEAACRELVEETGYAASEMVYLTEGPPSPGISTEVIVFFRAKGLIKTAEGGGDASEEIIVHEAPLGDIDNWLQQKKNKGVAIDPKIYTGLYFLWKETRQ